MLIDHNFFLFSYLSDLLGGNDDVATFGRAAYHPDNRKAIGKAAPQPLIVLQQLVFDLFSGFFAFAQQFFSLPPDFPP